MNKKLSPRERGLIKGALRRVFSRSDLRREALAVSVIKGHVDPSRPRVTKWSKCPICEKCVPTYKMEVDHVEPLIPYDTTLEEMNWDTVVERLWCDAENLLAMCQDCHDTKTKAERKLRKEAKDAKSGKAVKKPGPRSRKRSTRRCSKRTAR